MTEFQQGVYAVLESFLNISPMFIGQFLKHVDYVIKRYPDCHERDGMDLALKTITYNKHCTVSRITTILRNACYA